MSQQKEKLFFNQLKEIFIGVKLEGESGFINLMRIKSSYFDIIFKELVKEIEDKTKDFPEFKEEMFDKLFTFFKTYFSESGSIYFSYTPLKSKIYDKIYASNKDVILFWKTHMLYYVKTDRLWNNLSVDFDEGGIKYKINFDVSNLEHKIANEKKSIIYELKNNANKEIKFNVLYSESGRKTKIDDILKEFKKNNIFIEDEQLTRIFKIFEKQNEVDYFINKNAEQFLKEQFELWIKNYVLDEKSIFDEKRLKQLKIIKDIAFKVIDFVSQFEDELVKVWNKPKFVINSNYVITLNKIADKDNGIEIIEEIINCKKFEEQIQEWGETGIEKNVNKNKILITNLKGKQLNPQYQYLPIDTKYFEDKLKFRLIQSFDNLDGELDGWLIHSENYQALKTISPKFKGKIQTIFIDPPFNLEQNADYFYNVKYKDASWITILENRVNLSRDLISNNGSIFVRCDYHGNMYVRLLLNDIFGGENFRNEMIISRTRAKQKVEKQFIQQTDSLFFFSKGDDVLLKEIERPREPEWHSLLHFPRANDKPRTIKGKTYYPPKGRRWAISQVRIDTFEKRSKIRTNPDDSYIDCHGNEVKGVPELLYDTETVGNEWMDIPGYAQGQHFPTENSEELLKRVIESSSDEGNIVLDYFLGSGTTSAVAHKLKRKWIGVELGEHFYSVILPRMKKVLAGDKSGVSKEVNWKGGGFFKYYDLEQYEQTLKKTVYKESHPFTDFNDKSIYQQYVFLKDVKLLKCMELDQEKNRINIDFSQLYPNLDVGETLSNLTGNMIAKLSDNNVKFIDETLLEFNNIDFGLIKPLIWW